MLGRAPRPLPPHAHTHAQCTHRVRPKSGPSAMFTAALNDTRPASIQRHTSQFSRNTSMLMDDPTLTKNRPRSRPLNGRMSASTCVCACVGGCCV